MEGLCVSRSSNKRLESIHDSLGGLNSIPLKNTALNITKHYKFNVSFSYQALAPDEPIPSGHTQINNGNEIPAATKTAAPSLERLY